MALFCAAIWRDSVFRARFSFLSHVHVLSFEMLLISHINIRRVFFLPIFSGKCRSVGPRAVSIVSGGCIQSFCLCFSMYSSSRCSDVPKLSSMLASPIPPTSLDTYSLWTSCLGCNALRMVISFIVLWSICLSSSVVHFKNGPEYLTKDTALVFIALIRFLQHSFVLNRYLAFLIYFFLNFSFISTCLMVSASKMP